MRRRIFVSAMVLILVAAVAGGQAPAQQSSPELRQVIEFMRERKHAYERTDVAVWGKHVAERCTFVEAGGRVLDKAEFVGEIKPFVGYTFTVVVEDVRAEEFGDAIVLTYREKDVRDYGAQRTENFYVDTETYKRVSDEWQLIAFTENALPKDPALVKLSAEICEKYVGVYEVNSKATFTVTYEGDKLMGQYAGEEKFELLPASKTEFFSRGDSAEYVFVWDKAGRVVGHVYRAEGTEVRYKKRGIVRERR
jgi:hypothetical protein